MDTMHHCMDTMHVQMRFCVDPRLTDFKLEARLLPTFGSHIGFGGHFEFCNGEMFHLRHIVWIQCMSICDFVLTRFTDFERQGKK